jgi:hypothetical protein
MNVRSRILVVLNKLLDHCPHCGEFNLPNKAQSEFSGHEYRECADCLNRWTDASFILNQDQIVFTLSENGLIAESAELRAMGQVAYEEFIAQNFEIRRLIN